MPKKKINETIFINLFFLSRCKDFSIKVCFGFCLTRWAHGLNGREEAVKNLWSHFGIITIYCSWMIVKFFIRTNKHKNMFSWKRFFFSSRSSEKVRDSSRFSVSPSCMKRAIHCCPICCLGVSEKLLGFQVRAKRAKRALFSISTVYHNFYVRA